MTVLVKRAIRQLCVLYRLIDKRQHCFYCGVPTKPSDRTRDHAVPLAQNGPTHRHNSLNACAPCNHAKGGHTIEEFRAARYAGKPVEFYGETIVRQWRDQQRVKCRIANREADAKPWAANQGGNA